MSTLQVATVKSQSTAAPVFQNSSGTEKGQLAKSWISFDMSGSASIRDSFNVSSISDNGVGKFGINLSTAHANANYSIVASGSHYSGVYLAHPYVRDRGNVSITSSFFQVDGYNSGDNPTDIRDTFVATFGD